jgi:hypothetical protein
MIGQRHTITATVNLIPSQKFVNVGFNTVARQQSLFAISNFNIDSQGIKQTGNGTLQLSFLIRGDSNDRPCTMLIPVLFLFKINPFRVGLNATVSLSSSRHEIHVRSGHGYGKLRRLLVTQLRQFLCIS